MKYTKEQLSKMSNFQVNRAVAEKLGLKLVQGVVTKREGAEWVRVVPYRNFDPCNDWGDAGPIIESYNISILYDCYDDDVSVCGIGMFAECGQILAGLESESTNTLRAAMEVYLMQEVG